MIHVATIPVFSKPNISLARCVPSEWSPYHSGESYSKAHLRVKGHQQPPIQVMSGASGEAERGVEWVWWADWRGCLSMNLGRIWSSWELVCRDRVLFFTRRSIAKPTGKATTKLQYCCQAASRPPDLSLGLLLYKSLRDPLISVNVVKVTFGGEGYQVRVVWLIRTYMYTYRVYCINNYTSDLIEHNPNPNLKSNVERNGTWIPIPNSYM